MLCQKCGHLEATIHDEDTVYRRKIEQHLCPLCAGVGDGSLPFLPLGKRPEPGHTSGVFAAIAGYMTRLYAADARSSYSYLSVSVTNDCGILVLSQVGSMSPTLMVQCGKPAGIEHGIRDFFMHHEIPLHDFISDKGIIRYQLPDSPDKAARFLAGLLAACFDVKENDRLEFTFG